MASMTLCCCGELRRLAQDVDGRGIFSSSVGPEPEKTPSGEWYGPHRFSPPRIAVISIAHLMSIERRPGERRRRG